MTRPIDHSDDKQIEQLAKSLESISWVTGMESSCSSDWMKALRSLILKEIACGMLYVIQESFLFVDDEGLTIGVSGADIDIPEIKFSWEHLMSEATIIPDDEEILDQVADKLEQWAKQIRNREGA